MRLLIIFDDTAGRVSWLRDDLQQLGYVRGDLENGELWEVRVGCTIPVFCIFSVLWRYFVFHINASVDV